jgi:hypothetical protein
MTTETLQPLGHLKAQPVHDDLSIPLAIKRCYPTLYQPHAATTAAGSACMQPSGNENGH